MTDTQPTLVDLLLAAILNHPILAVLVVIGTIVIALAGFTDALTKLCVFLTPAAAPMGTVHADANPDGSATLTFKISGLPSNQNVDWIRLDVKQVSPEIFTEGSPASQVKPVIYDVLISPSILQSQPPRVEVETRLIPSSGEPYALAEVVLWWDLPGSSLEVELTPTFLNAHRKVLPIDTQPQGVRVRLTNNAVLQGQPRQEDVSNPSTSPFSSSGLALSGTRADAEPLSSLDGALERAFQAAVSAEGLEQLRTMAADENLRTPYVIEGLWYGAATWSLLPDFARNDDLQSRTLRAVVLATLLEIARTGRSWPSDENLFELGPNSLSALREGTGLAERDGPLESLFRRRPPLRVGFWKGVYRYIRFDIPSAKKRIVMESADTVFADLRPEALIREETLPPPKATNLPIDALSYSFPLEVMNQFVLAAKVYACLSLLPPETENRKYGLLLIANAFYAASLIEGNGHSAITLSRTAAFPMREAIRLLGASPPEGGTMLRSASLSPRLTAMWFFGRDLETARESYREAAAQTDREQNYRLYGAWGTAVTSMGLGDAESAVPAFRAVVPLLDPPDPHRRAYGYMLGALFDSLDAEDPARVFLAENAPALERWWGESLEESDRYHTNLNFARVLWIIGRPHEAARFWMRELARAPVRRVPNPNGLEAHYLRELGATLSDVFDSISWRLTFEKGPRPVHRVPLEADGWRDFAPTWIDNVFDRGRGRPYGAVSPEEDRATCLEAAGGGAPPIVPSALRGAVIGEPEDDPTTQSAAKFRSDLATWAHAELQQGNYEPLLKLTWVEWFALPLREFAEPSFDPRTWSYIPRPALSVAQHNALELLVAPPNPEVSHSTRAVARTFLAVHHFLEERYGPSAS